MEHNLFVFSTSVPTNPQNMEDSWFDNPAVLFHAEAPLSLPDGSVVLVGGFVNRGYVNRNMPNTDPAYEGGTAEPTFEFYTSRGGTPQVTQFMITTSRTLICSSYRQAIFLCRLMFPPVPYQLGSTNKYGSLQMPTKI